MTASKVNWQAIPSAVWLLVAFIFSFLIVPSVHLFQAVGIDAAFFTPQILTALLDSCKGAVSAAIVLTPLCCLIAISIQLSSHKVRLFLSIIAGAGTLACSDVIYSELGLKFLEWLERLTSTTLPTFLVVTITNLWRSLPLLILLPIAALAGAKSKGEAAVNLGQSWLRYSFTFLPRVLWSTGLFVFFLILCFALATGGSPASSRPDFRSLPELIHFYGQILGQDTELNSTSLLLTFLALVAFAPTLGIRVSPWNQSPLYDGVRSYHKRRLLEWFFFVPLSLIPIALPILLIAFSFLWSESYSHWTVASLIMDSSIRQMFIFQVFLAILCGALTLTLSLRPAIIVARRRIVLPKAIMLLLITPLVLPEITFAYSLSKVLTPVRSMLVSDTMDSIIIVLSGAFRAAPLAFLIALTFLQARTFTREDAALNLGANRSIVFRQITLPSITPVIALIFLLSAMVFWSSYYCHSYLSAQTTFTVWLFNSMVTTADTTAWFIHAVVLILFYFFCCILVIMMLRNIRDNLRRFRCFP